MWFYGASQFELMNRPSFTGVQRPQGGDRGACAPTSIALQSTWLLPAPHAAALAARSINTTDLRNNMRR